MMYRIMKETAIEAYREQADLHTVAERMKGKTHPYLEYGHAYWLLQQKGL